jgi:colicin import membrane protein
MNEEFIKTELQKYNMTDAAIAKLGSDYMALTVKDASDTPGYEIVKRARIDIKKRRVEVEKTRVTLKAESLEYGRRVDGEAKRITALLEPIEAHLIGQEKIVEDEKARLKAEAEAKEAERLQVRVDRICAFGAQFNGQMYSAFGIQIPVALVKVCTDGQFEQFCQQIQDVKTSEDLKRKAAEDAWAVEQARVAKVAAEQEAERQRLAEIAKKQAAESAKIKAEQEAIEKAKQKLIDDEVARVAAVDREKKRIEDEKARSAELERVRLHAIEQARIDVEAKIKRQVEEKAAAELKAKIAAEKKAARAPDKQKILLHAQTIELSIVSPDMKTAEGKAIMDEFSETLSIAVKTMRDKAEVL